MPYRLCVCVCVRWKTNMTILIIIIHTKMINSNSTVPRAPPGTSRQRMCRGVKFMGMRIYERVCTQSVIIPIIFAGTQTHTGVSCVYAKLNSSLDKNARTHARSHKGCSAFAARLIAAGRRTQTHIGNWKRERSTALGGFLCRAVVPCVR